MHCIAVFLTCVCYRTPGFVGMTEDDGDSLVSGGVGSDSADDMDM